MVRRPSHSENLSQGMVNITATCLSPHTTSSRWRNSRLICMVKSRTLARNSCIANIRLSGSNTALFGLMTNCLVKLNRWTHSPVNTQGQTVLRK